MKNLLMGIVVTMMVFSLVGCSTKTEYAYVTPEPFSFQTTQQPKVREIRIHNKDIELYKAYITNFRNIIEFHNKQIENYYKDFNNIKGIK